MSGQQLGRVYFARECFGWLKDIALLRKLKRRGLFKVAWTLTFVAAGLKMLLTPPPVAPPCG
jgi:hypothetical protein